MALLNQYEIERYVQATAARADLRVVWENETKPRTDGKNLFLPSLTSKTTAADAEDIMFFVTHEVSHILHSDFKKISDCAIDAEKSFLGFINNAVEDDGVDAVNSASFRGDKILVSNSSARRVNDHVIPSCIKAIKEATPEQKETIDKVTSLAAWYNDARSDVIVGTSKRNEDLINKLSKEGRAYYDKLTSGGYTEKMRKLRTDDTLGRTSKAYALAKEIFRDVYKEDPEEEEKKNKQRQQETQSGGGKGKGEDEGEGSGKGSGHGEGEGDDGEGGKEAQKGKRSDKHNEKFTEVDYKIFSTDVQPLTPIRGYGGGQHISYKNHKRGRGHGDYTPTPFKENIVVDYKNKKSNHHGIRLSDDGYDRGYNDYYRKEAGKASDGFAQRVRMLLQIRSKSKIQYGTKHGMLHPSNLYRVTIKDIGALGQKVFKKRIVSDTLDTAVSILCDTSGSMSGDKYAHTIVAAIHLSNTLGNTLHIPTEVIGFTEHECRNTMFIHRDFDTKLLAKEELLKRMIHASSYMSQNCDGDSIVFAYNRLVQRKQKRKVLIVLSDGSPASSKGGDIYAYTQDIVKAIEADKRVEIIGVGIQDDNVEKIYKHHQVIQDSHEIESSLLKLIERKVFI